MLDLKSTFRYSYQSLSKDELVSREVTIFLGVSEQAAQTGLCPFKPFVTGSANTIRSNPVALTE
jgi:hypothetical protein